MSLELSGYSEFELVGEGGLGLVYRAVRTSTGGFVAIKELRDIAEASSAWHRARRELDAMLRLKGHPFVVSVEEIVEGPHGPCLVMEYVPGGSLLDRLAYGSLATPEIVLVGQQVSQALLAAHEVGMVHRDVKPHNVLVGQFGQVKVCDFGIAALARGGLQTQTQALTLGYASPEALDGDAPIGPPADVYSFGATMTHLLTGRRPSMQERLSGDRVAVRSSDPGLSGVVSLLDSCQAHRPDQRPSMAVVAATFDQAAIDLGARRITALGAPGVVDDRTIVRPAPPVIVAVPIIAPPAPTFSPPPIVEPAIVEPTLQRPIAQPQMAVPTVVVPQRRSATAAALVGAFAAVVVLVAVAILLVARSGRGDASASSPNTPSSTAATAQPPG